MPALSELYTENPNIAPGKPLVPSMEQAITWRVFSVYNGRGRGF